MEFKIPEDNNILKLMTYMMKGSFVAHVKHTTRRGAEGGRSSIGIVELLIEHNKSLEIINPFSDYVTIHIREKENITFEAQGDLFYVTPDWALVFTKVSLVRKGREGGGFLIDGRDSIPIAHYNSVSTVERILLHVSEDVEFFDLNSLGAALLEHVTLTDISTREEDLVLMIVHPPIDLL